MSTAIEAGKAFLRLLVENKDFGKGLDESLTKLKDFSKSALKVGAELAGVGAAITAPFAAGLAVFSSVGTELEHMSKRTGIAVEALSELKFAAEESGTDLAGLEGAIRKMQKALGEAETGSGEAAAKFAAIGVSISSLQGLTPDAQFEKIAEAIGAINDPAQRAAAAISIFGKTGTIILPLVENVKELREKAKELGVTMSADTAKDAATFHNAMGALGQQFQAVAIAIGASIAPALTALVEAISSAIPAVIDFIKENRGLLIVTALAGVTLGAVGAVLGTIGTVGWVAAAGIKAVSAALLLLEKNPWLIVITVALTALVPLLGALIDKWIGTASATDAAAGSTARSTEAMRAQNAAIGEGNKKLDERAAALANLTPLEKDYLGISERRKAGEKSDKATADLRVQAIDEEIRGIQESAAAQNAALAQQQDIRARLIAEQHEGGSAKFQANVTNALQANDLEQAGIKGAIAGLAEREQALRDKRDQITGDDAKKRAEAEKKADEEIAEHKKQLAKAQEEQAKAFIEAQKKHFDSLVRMRESVLSQLDSFSRPTSATFNGRLAPQIFGRSAADLREERQLKIQEENRGFLKEIRDSLKQAGVIMVGNG